MERPEFVYVTYIATTPEKVWAALTDGELSREYWGGRAVESDWNVGSPVRFRMASGKHDPVRGTVTEAEPPRRLVMTWVFDFGAEHPPTPATRVLYLIERAGPENVKLTVVHEPLEPGSEVDAGVRRGWPAILSSLKSFLETGKALEITKRWGEAGL